MKRVFIIMACFAAVACTGSGDKSNKSASQTLDGPVGGKTIVVDNVSTTAHNYQEMAMSALENGDSETFMLAMEQMTEWLNGLSDEDRAKADAAIEAWKGANKERMDANYERALTMPRMTSAEAKALSKK